MWAWSFGGMVVTEENRSTRRETFTVATTSTKDSTWTCLGWNSHLRCESEKVSCVVSDRYWVVLDGSGRISRITNVAVFFFIRGPHNVVEWTQLSAYDRGLVFLFLGKFWIPSNIYKFCGQPVEVASCGCHLWSERDWLQSGLGGRLLYVQFAGYGLRLCHAVYIRSAVVN